MPAGLPQDAVGQTRLAGPACELLDGSRSEWPDLDAAGHGGQRGTGFRVVLGPDRGDHEQPAAARVPAKVVHEFDGRLARILKVVQHDQHRVTCRKPAQEAKHGQERPAPLHVDRNPFGRHRSEHRRGLRHQRGERRRSVAQQPPQLRGGP